jgi:SAM-dependent methyltransferase
MAVKLLFVTDRALFDAVCRDQQVVRVCVKIAMAQDKPHSISFYDANAIALADQYEGIPAIEVHAPIADLIPRTGLALDVGAGSGRDAAWLASLGYVVVAAEPAGAMRREGARRHPTDSIRWLDDRLPDLSATHQLGLSFELILASAVWMHVPPPSRQRAFRKLVTLLKPGGVFIVTLRSGPSETDRPMWPTSSGEIEALARTHGLAVVRSVAAADQLKRPGVPWTAMCLRLPDDGSAALPLMRGIILNDDKASTYKLALVRSIARVADSTPGLASERLDEDLVDVPLGAVALNWIRMFLPLVALALPQAPGNAGPDGLAFAKDGFRSLSAQGIASQDLRIGARFTGARAQAVFRALSEAKSTIARMPANFIRYPNSDARIFHATPAWAPRARDSLVIDSGLMGAYGIITVPGHVWRAMQRLGAWIEPVLVSEWARMTRNYAERMGHTLAAGVVEEALVWLEPSRDTAIARQVAVRFFESGRPLRCVWTGVRLRPDAFDIDHCFPWSAWPCGDLWNLLPASPRVNQHMKRDRLPSSAALAGSRDAIVGWWNEAWHADEALGERFSREAAAALPVSADARADDVFAGVEWRRLRLRQDQQLQEWAGAERSAD